ncbi:LysR family transcriptional regulator [Roseococcus sp. YIM B11640]|uniref:LysR family transcriptional regulator n=1 Tax=Roseococcus sp. YIM B11640 TaxID=3133973 RepID=UPI003C7CA92B
MADLAHSLDWSLLRAFVAVIRHGSLSAAARALRLTQPTLGRQVRALEEQLGEALFDRLPSGLRPNARAMALLAQAEAMDQAAAELSTALAGNPDAPSGTVRLSSSEIIGTRVLVPILGDLAISHPEIEIELSISNTYENLLRRDADIAVRLDRPAQEEVIAQRVGELEVGMFASRAYLKRRGMPSSLTDLGQHRMIGPDQDQRAMSIIMERRGLPLSRGLFTFRSDSRLAQEAAVRAGIGIGPIRTFEVEDDPEMVRVLPQGFVERLPIWVTAHPDMRHARRLRVVYDAVVAGFRARFK